MSDLKKAAQAALDWADVILGNDWSARPKQRLGEVAEQLREALAEPEQSGWIGLTDDCVENIWEAVDLPWVTLRDTKSIIRETESVLRVKNARPPLTDDQVVELAKKSHLAERPMIDPARKVEAYGGERKRIVIGEFNRRPSKTYLGWEDGHYMSFKDVPQGVYEIVLIPKGKP